MHGHPQNLSNRRNCSVHNRRKRRNGADFIGTNRYDIKKAESGD